MLRKLISLSKQRLPAKYGTKEIRKSRSNRLGCSWKRSGAGVVSIKTHLNKEKREENGSESLLRASIRNRLTSSVVVKWLKKEKLFPDILNKGKRVKWKAGQLLPPLRQATPFPSVQPY